MPSLSQNFDIPLACTLIAAVTWAVALSSKHCATHRAKQQPCTWPYARAGQPRRQGLDGCALRPAARPTARQRRCRMCKHVSHRVCGKPTSWQPTICTAAETAPRNGLGWMPIGKTKRHVSARKTARTALPCNRCKQNILAVQHGATVHGGLPGRPCAAAPRRVPHATEGIGLPPSKP